MSVASHSVATLDRPRNKPKIEPYVSPFILRAKQKAEERAKMARQKLGRRRSPVRDEWNTDTTSAGLFDPTIKKQEIFRLGPPRAEESRSRPRESPSSSSAQRHYASSTANRPAPPRPLSPGKNFVASNIQAVRASSSAERERERERRVSPSGRSYLAPTTASAAALVEGIAQHQRLRRNERLTMRTSTSVPQRLPTRTVANSENRAQNRLAVSLEFKPLDLATATEREPHDDLLYPNPSVSTAGRAGAAREAPSSSSVIAVDSATQTASDHEDYSHDETVHAPDQPKPNTVIPSLSLVDREIISFPVSQQTTHPSPPSDTATPAPVEDVRNVYKQMIRDRLRLLLQKHRGGPREASGGAEGEEEGEEEEMPAEVRRPFIAARDRSRYQGVSLRPASHDLNAQIYMRDMMASMAQIMTAVGEMVANNNNNNNNNDNNNSRRNRRRRSRSQRRRSVSPPPPPPPPFCENDHLEREMLHGKDITGEDLLAVAEALHPPVSKKKTILRRKHQALDLVMQKLQSIERCEQEIRDFLAKPLPVVVEKQPPSSAAIDTSAEIVTQPSKDAIRKAPSVAARQQLSRPQSKPSALWEKFPQLRAFQDHDENEEILRYMSEMEKIKKLKEVAFERKQSTSQITGDNVANEIFDKIVRSVADDFEQFFDNYSQSFVNQV